MFKLKVNSSKSQARKAPSEYTFLSFERVSSCDSEKRKQWENRNVGVIKIGGKRMWSADVSTHVDEINVQYWRRAHGNHNAVAMIVWTKFGEST